MYLPVTCSFRLTDIYRSYIAQRILFENNSYLTFHPSTVRQIRNAHNLIEDFKYETQSYIQIEKLVNILTNLKLKKGSKKIFHNLISCYKALIKENFFDKSELRCLLAWINDIKKLDENSNF